MPLTTTLIEQALQRRGLSPTQQWTNPMRAAWYSWKLAHVGQGPYLSIRLICPIVPRRGDKENVRISRMGFEVVLIASAGCKTQRVLTRFGVVAVTDTWADEVIALLKRVNKVMSEAPRCVNCGAAMYPEHVKSTSRLFWSCSRYPTCKGMKRMPVTKRGRSPRKLEEL